MIRIILGILVASIITNVFMVYQIRSKSLSYDLLSVKLDMLEQQVDQAAKQIEAANKTAESESKKSDDEIVKINSTDVPKKCEDAIKWAIGQSRQF